MLRTTTPLDVVNGNVVIQLMWSTWPGFTSPKSLFYIRYLYQIHLLIVNCYCSVNVIRSSLPQSDHIIQILMCKLTLVFVTKSTVYVIIQLLWSNWPLFTRKKSVFIVVFASSSFANCYCSVNVIRSSLPQSDHIIQILLYKLCYWIISRKLPIVNKIN